VSGYRKFNIKHDFEVKHVVTAYAEWIREGRFTLDPSRNSKPVTIHDPCNAVRKCYMEGFYPIDEDTRFVLKNVCENVVECYPNRANNYCCSGGGGALISGFKKGRTHYGKIKVEQIDRTGAELVCTPCVNCLDGIENLARDYERKWESIHLWELLANAIVLDEDKEAK
jgi:Fe-S oxidoreductase